jgi:hypothetical protein
MTARDGLFVDPAGTGDNAPGTDAADARLALAGLIQSGGSSPLAVQRGVFAGNADSLRVIPGSGLTVVVRPGMAVIPRNEPTGPYLVSNDSNTTVAIPDANTSFPRIDLVYMRQEDKGAGDDTTRCTFGVITGLPASSPQAPTTLPFGAIELAAVRVEARATSIAASGITIPAGWRPWTVARGGVQPIGGWSELPPTPFNGQSCFVGSAGVLAIWAGAKWNIFTDGFGSWVGFQPLLRTVAGQDVLLGNGYTADCKYKWNGATTHLQATIFFGSSGVDGRSGSVLFRMPDTLRTFGFMEQTISAKISVPGYGSMLGEGHVAVGAEWMTLSFPIDTTSNLLEPLRSCNLDNQGLPIVGTGVPKVPNSFPLIAGSKLMIWGTLNTAQPSIVGGRYSVYS